MTLSKGMYVKARREASDLEIQMADKTQQARVQNVDENYLIATWGLRPRLYAYACFAGLDSLC